MIIHEPTVTTTADEVLLQTGVEVGRHGAAYPPSLWFSFPRTYERFVGGGSDAFATALLPLAMNLGERLRIDGTVSYRLAAGIREYQRVQSLWHPEMYRQVEVEFRGLRSRPASGAAGAVGLAFSGGVDSFHTLWAHLPENEPYPPFRVTHCLIVNGFDDDSDLAGAGSFRALEALYEPVVAAHGLTLLPVRTNLLRFLGPWLRLYGFGAFLTAPALALGGLFSRYYVSAGFRFSDMGLRMEGSHLMLDHLLSTETMETSHEGAHLTRLEKTLAISAWPETYDTLRVCFYATGVQAARRAVANCCACEKCLRTMVTLELAGSLKSYACFPEPLTRRAIRAIDFTNERRELFVPEIIRYAQTVGRRDIAGDLRFALFKSTKINPPIRALVGASFRMESRSRAYAAVAGAGKRALRSVGFGRGWLY